MVRFLYVTDLHGWIPGYEAILRLATECGIRIIVNGGDIVKRQLSFSSPTIYSSLFPTPNWWW